VVPDREAKSIGAEDTFDEDITAPEELRPHIHAQALRVGERLRHAGLRSRCVQLKLKLSVEMGTLRGFPNPPAMSSGGGPAYARRDLQIVTRRTTFPAATDDGQALYRAAMELLRAHPPAAPVRLTGVSAQSLEPVAASQMALFSGAPTAADKINVALDRITEKFGSGALTTADLASTAGSGSPRTAPDRSTTPRSPPAPRSTRR
jgi:DNA polymerase-4